MVFKNMKVMNVDELNSTNFDFRCTLPKVIDINNKRKGVTVIAKGGRIHNTTIKTCL